MNSGGCGSPIFPPVRISATPGPALAHYWQVHYKYYTFCVWSIQPIELQVHLRLILGEQFIDYSYVKKLSICVLVTIRPILPARSMSATSGPALVRHW